MRFLGQKPSTLILWVVLAIPAVVRFGPLIGLWAYRLWYWCLRPRAASAAG
jgi:hypothetical protein